MNVSRYVGNGVTGAVDPSGLQEPTLQQGQALYNNGAYTPEMQASGDYSAYANWQANYARTEAAVAAVRTNLEGLDPAVARAYITNYGTPGVQRLINAWEWEIAIGNYWRDQTADAETRILYIDNNDRNDLSATEIAARLNDALVNGIEDGTISPTTDVATLQAGDISVWNGAGTQHAGFAMGQVTSLNLLRDTRNSIVLELSMVGAAATFLRVADNGVEFIDDAVDVAQAARRSIPLVGSGWTARRTGQLAAMIPSQQAGRITMGVGLARNPRTGRMVRLIGTSEPNRYLRPGVVLRRGEILVPGSGHAEVNIVNYANQHNLELLEIGATRPVCVPCQRVIGSLVDIVTPLRNY